MRVMDKASLENRHVPFLILSLLVDYLNGGLRKLLGRHGQLGKGLFAGLRILAHRRPTPRVVQRQVTVIIVLLEAHCRRRASLDLVAELFDRHVLDLRVASIQRHNWDPLNRAIDCSVRKLL